jgi:hypothetical protein
VLALGRDRRLEEHVLVGRRFGVDTGTFALAQWCKLLRDRGWTGQQVARSLGRSDGYVNNLIRIVERASIEVLARWRSEQSPASGLVPVCATDWLMQVCVLPHDQQLAELARRIERLEGARREPG